MVERAFRMHCSGYKTCPKFTQARQLILILSSGQELLKEGKKCVGAWSFPPALPTNFFFFCGVWGGDGEWDKEKKSRLGKISRHPHALFQDQRKTRGFSLELVDTFSPSDYTRPHQHLTHGYRAHGSAIYKHHPGIPETLM